MNKNAKVCADCGAPLETKRVGSTASLGLKFLHTTLKCKNCGAWCGGFTTKKKKNRK